MSFGGKAAHDALQRLAVSLEPRAFVDRDVRAASLRRLRDDAVGECLRIFQLCATPTLGVEGNLRLVWAPCVRWCVCARLLRAVGRRVDEAVRRDVAAAVAAVAAAAHSRAERDEDDDQRCDGLAPPDGPNGPTRHRCPVERPIERTRTVHSRRRRDRSTAGASQTLVEDAERVVTALADQMLGGWKGAPAERGDSPGGDSPGGDPTDDAWREWRDVANDAARDFADAVADPLASALLSEDDDSTSFVTECVDRLLTPAAVAVANAAARVAAGADDVTRGPSGGHPRWSAFEPPAACATAAADCCDRIRGACMREIRVMRLEEETGSGAAGFGFGFGIDAFTGSAGAGGTDGGVGRGGGGVFGAFSGRGFETGAGRDGARDFLYNGGSKRFHSALSALRRTCESGKVAEELATAARTAHAAAASVVLAARDERTRTGRSGVRTPRGATHHSRSIGIEREDSEDEEEDTEGIRAARADARRALRSCDSAARCSRLLADVSPRGVAAALYLPLAKRTKSWTTRRVGAPSFANCIVHGSQAAKDFAREGDGIALAAGPGGAFERIPTGPFLAHFVAACGAVEAALRSQRILDDEIDEEDPVTRISRWMPPTTPTPRGIEPAKKKRPEGDSTYAQAAARVVLCACRTVRGGDALDFIRESFPQSLGFVAGAVQPSETAGFYESFYEIVTDEEEHERTPRMDASGPTRRDTNGANSNSPRGVRPGGFAPVEVRVTRRRVVVTARDAFVVSRDEGAGRGSGVTGVTGVTDVTDLRAWCVVCVESEQTLEPVRRDAFHGSSLPAQLEPASTSIRLDPRASRERMDERLRELRSGNRA